MYKKNDLESIHTKLLLGEDDIIEIQLKDDCYYSDLELKEIIINAISITNNIHCKLLIIAGNYSLCDIGVIRLSKNRKSTDLIASIAIVACSLSQILIANFIAKNVNTHISCGVFKSKTEAVAWLKTAAKKNVAEV